MKLLHIADLHIGKRVHGISMLQEQTHAISQLLNIASEENIAGVLIAGDVFDRPYVSHEALEVAEQLFLGLHNLGVSVYVVPGNHDSAQQLSFCSRLLSSANMYIARQFKGEIESYILVSGPEQVCIHLLPFVRPTDVRMAMPDLADELKTHDDAVRAALSVDKLKSDVPNILVAHQFVTGSGQEPQTCDSELISVGGADNVDSSAFDKYDYVALGHLHCAQQVQRPEVRYSGSPLKYSISEINHNKSVTIVNIQDSNLEISTREITPLHQMRQITASYKELEDGIDVENHSDYMHVILTDKSLHDAMAKLRAIYPNIMRLDWVMHELGNEKYDHVIKQMEQSTPLELFEDFYMQQTQGKSLDEKDIALLNNAIEKAQHEAS